MPLCTIHLLSLHPTTPAPLTTFLSTLHSTSLKPLIISRVLRWIILPSTLSTDPLLAQNIPWHLLLIVPDSSSTLPAGLTPLIQYSWSLVAGIPSRLLQDFSSKNAALLHPDPDSVPKLSSDSGANDGAALAPTSQNLELSPALQAWISTFSTSNTPEALGAVSMLNLLSFKSGMKPSYLKYGAEFSKSIGSSRGGNAKIVGTVVEVNGSKKKAKKEGDEEGEDEGEALWDEVALAHYPSILHFADMLKGKDYQEVNQKYRVPALRDTFILATSEIGISEVGEGRKGVLSLSKL
ncbi:hypothetical protein BCR34DRAFT_474601 [Clohesyomyces aquaticus]|uniref:Uncharacterized protein n=1 Tax=Clohesyomyces aquaticus TaxID=1231657 RepID=A0A1Y2A5A9_9PLEO|nr:hypothetical protein BCR34DRAFT_474601 [Clohesyomyces aquaticus]